MSLNNYSNKSKKLIIYFHAPFFDTWPKKWELDKFKNYGFDVELWSAEEIFYKLENIKSAASGSRTYLYKDLDIAKIKNLTDLENKVAELNSEAVVCIMGLGSLTSKTPTNDNSVTHPDLDIFNKYKIKYAFHHIPHFVVPSFLFKLKYQVSLFQKKLSNYKKKPSLIIGSGSQGREQAFKIYKNKFIYKSVPFFNILWLKEEPIINEKYIIYVEENVNLAPDAILVGQKQPNHDLEGFYKRINDVFEKIENWTNLKVIIAASGKYDYKINPFNNRQIIYKKTSQLIQHSELVIGHKSLALHQAIADFKPILLFKDESFNDLRNKVTHNLALAYRKNSIWTNQLTKTIFEKNNYVNLVHNKQLINQYLKEDNITGTFIENVASAFHQI
jgi:hypothetical protein